MDLSSPTLDRERLGWWALVFAVGLALLFVLHSFVGTFVLALFVYYGIRPLNQRLESVFSPGTAALVSLLVVALPALLLITAVVVMGVTQLLSAGALDGLRQTIQPYLQTQSLDLLERVRSLVTGGASGSPMDLLMQGAGVLSTLAGGGMHLFLAVTAAFYLLRDDARLASWFRSTVGGTGTTAHAYVTAVDDDLGTIYFGNVLLVGIVAVLAAVVYNGYNVLAPAAVSMPAPTALALLTGLASLVPVVVGKLVYVPLVAFLGVRAARSDPSLLIYPAALFAVSLVLLDLLPMTFLLPKVAGQATHTGLVLFAYILGSMLFGWYGLFLGPLLLVVGIQAVRIVLEELLDGDPVSPEVTSAESLGSDPNEADSAEDG
ncbi:AI-2E family transporter [Haloarcula amylovorans]|uniref:AI-2E family transporter n=1 Tax=Haloarcula amylovorans TaxID=2562280 RepID=UPI0010762FDC|nr:AI-2E family transporter [Halomicroarcula amylolytica]